MLARHMKPTKAQARQNRIQRQIKQLLKTYHPERVFSAHDMASSMREVWSRVPTNREISHALIRLAEQRVVNRARHYERQSNAGNTNMYVVNAHFTEWSN